MKISIGIEPKPAPRPRFGKRAFMPKEYQAYKEILGAVVKTEMKDTPSTLPLRLNLTFRRKYKVDSRRYGDLDNLVKGVMDALIGVVFVDDAQVIGLTAGKVQTAEAGIDIDFEFEGG